MGMLIARPGSMARISGYAEATQEALNRAALAPMAFGAEVASAQV